jgi:hypothetical protein
MKEKIPLLASSLQTVIFFLLVCYLLVQDSTVVRLIESITSYVEVEFACQECNVLVEAIPPLIHDAFCAHKFVETKAEVLIV